MAQLGGALRISFTSARVEKTNGLFNWGRRTRDQDVWLEWRADGPPPSPDAAPALVAQGRITLSEIRWWGRWFSQAEAVRSLGAKLGTAPADPVARLWTPLAGQTVEFFVWPEATGGLVLLALFVPDPGSPSLRTAVETSATAEELTRFGTELENEADQMAQKARKQPQQ